MYKNLFFTLLKGESSRARRFGRGLKTLHDLLKHARAGRPINPEDIPPEVNTGENRPSVPVPIRPAPQIPLLPTEPQKNEPESQPELPPQDEIQPETNTQKSETINMLKNRMNEYKKSALISKKSGEMQKAIAFMKIGKQFEIVIKAVMDDQEVDLSSMPGPPDLSEPINKEPDPGLTPTSNAGPSQELKEDSETQSQESEEVTLITTENLLDGLIMRMGVYKQQEENAKTEGKCL